MPTALTPPRSHELDGHYWQPILAPAPWRQGSRNRFEAQREIAMADSCRCSILPFLCLDCQRGCAFLIIPGHYNAKRQAAMPSGIKTIFFDVGNTLLFPNRERIHAPLTERGILCDAAQFRDLECRVKNEFDSLMNHDGNRDHSFWLMFYTRLFANLGVDDDALRNQLVSNTRESANWDLILPGTREHLLRLAERYRIGVISNADGKIEDVLRRCGIADCFLSITDSGLVGYEKPHPEIFRQAMRSLNAQPNESLYVGDVYFVDYLGATQAGMQAVLMDVPGAYTGKGVPRVESLAELQDMLADAIHTGE